jgi:catechol 2,3-dioxygenase-like lactoylglutathione lyase family enzyme
VATALRYESRARPQSISIAASSEKMTRVCLATSHTGIAVSNLDRTIGFFCDVLGFREVDRGERDPSMAGQLMGLVQANVVAAFLERGDHTVELIVFSLPEERRMTSENPYDTGHFHLAFDVLGIRELTAAAARYGFLPLGDVVTVSAGPNAGSQTVYLQDPDHVTIQFIESRRERA